MTESGITDRLAVVILASVTTFIVVLLGLDSDVDKVGDILYLLLIGAYLISPYLVMGILTQFRRRIALHAISVLLGVVLQSGIGGYHWYQYTLDEDMRDLGILDLGPFVIGQFIIMVLFLGAAYAVQFLVRAIGSMKRQGEK